VVPREVRKDVISQSPLLLHGEQLDSGLHRVPWAHGSLLVCNYHCTPSLQVFQFIHKLTGRKDGSYNHPIHRLTILMSGVVMLGGGGGILAASLPPGL